MVVLFNFFFEIMF